MDDIASLIKAAGGQRKAARLLGVPSSTLHSWLRAGTAPPWRQEKIEQLLSELRQLTQAAA